MSWNRLDFYRDEVLVARWPKAVFLVWLACFAIPMFTAGLIIGVAVQYFWRVLP